MLPDSYIQLTGAMRPGTIRSWGFVLSQNEEQFENEELISISSNQQVFLLILKFSKVVFYCA